MQVQPGSASDTHTYYTHGITWRYLSSYLRSRSQAPACLGAATAGGTKLSIPIDEFNTTRISAPQHVPCATRPRARRSVEAPGTYLHRCYGHDHARTTVPTTSEAPLSCRSSTYSILHTPVNDWFVYAHDYALPGFRADARLHQRRHDRQEVRVDILHVTSVPILTSNS